jgi:hypothetical protein
MLWENDNGLQAETQFESKLRGLLAEYGYNLRGRDQLA